MLDAAIEKKQKEFTENLRRHGIRTTVVFYDTNGTNRKVGLYKPVVDLLEKQGFLPELGLTREVETRVDMAGGSRCFEI